MYIAFMKYTSSILAFPWKQTHDLGVTSAMLYCLNDSNTP